MNKKAAAVSFALAALLLIACAVFSFSEIRRKRDVSHIKITVLSNGEVKQKELDTKEKFLYDALYYADLIKGENGQYGFLVTEACGTSAGEGECFSIKINGEELLKSLEQTPVHGGEKIEFSLGGQ